MKTKTAACKPAHESLLELLAASAKEMAFPANQSVAEAELRAYAAAIRTTKFPPKHVAAVFDALSEIDGKGLVATTIADLKRNLRERYGEACDEDWADKQPNYGPRAINWVFADLIKLVQATFETDSDDAERCRERMDTLLNLLTESNIAGRNPLDVCQALEEIGDESVTEVATELRRKYGLPETEDNAPEEAVATEDQD